MAGAPPRTLRVAVQGCAHGELDMIYATVLSAQAAAADGKPIDLLICCGDFQAVRNEGDLECMACPPKYRAMHDFWAYYVGLKVAPVLTLVVGGNHEASNHMAELPYGGWLAPSIYYLGTSGVVRYRGLRVGGYSGIYKRYDYTSGYHEVPPYADGPLHSVNHTRSFDLWRLSHVCGPLDVLMSHDWPAGVSKWGDAEGLIRRKPHFEADIARGELGNPGGMALLHALRPRFWFAGHLHCKFSAVVSHAPRPGAPPSATRFLATDKPMRGRAFLQVLDVPVEGEGEGGLEFDPEWMALLTRTHAILPTGARHGALPPPLPVSGAEMVEVMGRLRAAYGGQGGAELPHVQVPLNFTRSAPPWTPPPGSDWSRAGSWHRTVPPPSPAGNPQHDALLAALRLPHVHTRPWAGGGGGAQGGGAGQGVDPSEIELE
jgi:lariat debranching enzyme